MTEPSASPEQKSECIKMFTVTNSASNSREMDEKSPARYQKKQKNLSTDYCEYCWEEIHSSYLSYRQINVQLH